MCLCYLEQAGRLAPKPTRQPGGACTMCTPDCYSPSSTYIHTLKRGPADQARLPGAATSAPQIHTRGGWVKPSSLPRVDQPKAQAARALDWAARTRADDGGVDGGGGDGGG